jgi:single-stranded-DNA-specific exonuclease
VAGDGNVASPNARPQRESTSYLAIASVLDDGAVTRLAGELQVSPVTARLLCIRGPRRCRGRRSAPVAPRSPTCTTRFALTDMATAVEAHPRAIARKELIAIHGDYDVDGVTSTVILRRALELLGAASTHFIPRAAARRLRPAEPGARRLHGEGVRLVISVDCGIRSVETARHARALGLDLIITDHHEPDTELPQAVAVINPKRHDCNYPDKNLAGVGVAAQAGAGALLERPGRKQLVAGLRQGRGNRHARGRGARWWARTGSLPSSGSPCCRRGRTRSACDHCSTSAA